MSKTIEEILAPKPEARPRIYAYSIDDQAHAGTANAITAHGMESQPRRGVIFVETPRINSKLRRSDIFPPMPPLRGLNNHPSPRFCKDGTPTEFTTAHPAAPRP
ncbi:MAG: hypothetical protein KIS67_25375 [Verrucomicrobiae bacterium]|nr:hypothetical protein [Verrucomicrobiae bacterium]